MLADAARMISARRAGVDAEGPRVRRDFEGVSGLSVVVAVTCGPAFVSRALGPTVAYF